MKYNIEKVQQLLFSSSPLWSWMLGDWENTLRSDFGFICIVHCMLLILDFQLIVGKQSSLFVFSWVDSISGFSPKTPTKDDWLRTSIFHTSCTIKDHKCHLIVVVIVRMRSHGKSSTSSSFQQNAFNTVQAFMVQVWQWGTGHLQSFDFLFYLWCIPWKMCGLM